MPTRTSQSPAGADATTARRRRAERSAEHPAKESRLAPVEQVALMVIGSTDFVLIYQLTGRPEFGEVELG
jgi:hypothetical protein